MKPVEDTQTVFWSNLEGGLSLLAVNLPSLWPLFSGRIASPLSGLVASTRSILSLHSIRGHSHRGSQEKESGNVFYGSRGIAGDSRLRMNKMVPRSADGDWYRLQDLESQQKVTNFSRTSESTGSDEERTRRT